MTHVMGVIETGQWSLDEINGSVDHLKREREFLQKDTVEPGININVKLTQYTEALMRQ